MSALSPIQTWPQTRMGLCKFCHRHNFYDANIKQREAKPRPHVSRVLRTGLQDFATKFYAAVPREVRDLIYSYLHANDPESYYSYLYILDGGEFVQAMHQVFFESRRLDGDSPTLPHWRQPAFVGAGFAHESTEFFYGNTVLQFHCSPYDSTPSTPANIDILTNLIEGEFECHTM